MTLHKESKATLTISIVFSTLISLVAFKYVSEPVIQYLIYGFAAFTFLIFLNFFRIPNKKININSEKVISPCDGKVVVIEEIEEKQYFNEKRIQVSIFMSPLNVHNNLAPIQGTVKTFKYLPGKYLMAFNPKSSTENEMSHMVIENERCSILVKQIAGFLARKICYYVKDGDKLNQGEEFGFIKFGSRVDLLLPIGTKIDVQLGQTVTGGISEIATLA